MPTQEPGTEPLQKNLTIIAGLVVVGLMAFGLTLSLYRNLLFEKTLQELEGRNHTLLQDIEQGYRDLEYFRSLQFKDKFAKEQLGRLNVGEKMLLILRTPETPTGKKRAPSSEEERQALYEEFLRQTPVIEHWMLYLFHREKLESMRRGL